MNIQKLEDEIRVLVQDFDEKSFVYDLLEVYGLPKAAITRLKQGAYNQSNSILEKIPFPRFSAGFLTIFY